MKMKLKKKHLILGVSLLVVCFIVSSCMVKADYSNSIEVDTKKDNGYSLVEETVNYSIYFANSESRFYFYGEFSYNISNSQVNHTSGILSLDLSNSSIKNVIIILSDNFT